MKGLRVQNLIIVGLIGLLVFLGFLQYSWQSKVSEAEKEKIEKRLKSDSERFAEDLNREIQAAYYGFHLNLENWREALPEYYRVWKANTGNPGLIEEMLMVFKDGLEISYLPEAGRFDETEPSFDFEALHKDSAAYDDQKGIFIVPVHKGSGLLIRRKEAAGEGLPLPEPAAFLIIFLDKRVLKEEMLRRLSDKYFSDGEFVISVSEKDGSPVYGAKEQAHSDSETPLFDLAPGDMAVFVNRNSFSRVEASETKSIVFNQRVDSFSSSSKNGKEKMQIKVLGDGKTRVFQGNMSDASSRWLLSANHRSGSIDNYISALKWKSLGTGFGILGVLAICILSISASAQRAKAFARKQVEFVSSVSHEFRTPLAVIYSASENLMDGVVDSPSEVSKYGALIKKEGMKLSGMVEQVLEFAGANSGKRRYDMRRVSPGPFIEEALSEAQPLAKEKGLFIEKNIADELPMVSADAGAMAQAVRNLLANSIKYSSSGGAIRVSAKNIDSKLRIAIEDEGIGIHQKDIRHIFEPFYRSKDVVDAQIHGNGLGLSIVKQIMDAHEGKVSVESTLGKGSRFVLEIPALG